MRSNIEKEFDRRERERRWMAEQAEMERIGEIKRMQPGRIFETRMYAAIAKFCRDANAASRKNSGKPVVALFPPDEKDDREMGTDMKLWNPDASLWPSSGLLRIDVTCGFPFKADMPFTADPGLLPGGRVNCCGQELRYGIRVANGNRCFNEPVAVIGVDGPENVRKDAIAHPEWTDIVENADAILNNAGSMVAAYYAAADPDYAAWLDARPDADPDGTIRPGILVPAPAFRLELHEEKNELVRRAVDLHNRLIGADPESYKAAYGALKGGDPKAWERRAGRSLATAKRQALENRPER